jgi:hypothetical protein
MAPRLTVPAAARGVHVSAVASRLGAPLGGAVPTRILPSWFRSCNGRILRLVRRSK